jgi:biotin carboxyl carrier protein
MKVRVTVGERSFEVEVGDLRDRPVSVTVDGRTFEVWPEDAAHRSAEKAPAPGASSHAERPAPMGGGTARPSGKTVVAPLPGVVASIAVHPGTVTSVGQELCVLEAMKMKNAIRAARPGRIATVHVSVGQHVRHNDPLVDYAD